jgi:hypothetical protein
MRRTAAQVFIVVFLLVQIALPLHDLFQERANTRGDFTWNMYSYDWRCGASYRVVLADGSERVLDPKAFFHRRSEATRVYYRDRLPRFHAFLCERMREERVAGRLIAAVECDEAELRRHRLVSPGTDLCSAENYGVLPE